MSNSTTTKVSDSSPTTLKTGDTPPETETVEDKKTA